jgi:hypothetical protein
LHSLLTGPRSHFIAYKKYSSSERCDGANWGVSVRVCSSGRSQITLWHPSAARIPISSESVRGVSGGDSEFLLREMHLNWLAGTAFRLSSSRIPFSTAPLQAPVSVKLNYI